MSEPIRIVAKVRFNSDFGYVLSRQPSFTYRRDGNILWAEDSGIYSCFVYEKPGRDFQAFAGREFTLPLADGGTVECKGQWWSGGSGELSKLQDVELSSFTHGTEGSLKHCYVYAGALVDREALARMLADYTGPTYDYWDYEKVLKFSDMRRDFWQRESRLKAAKENAVQQAQIWAQEARTQQSTVADIYKAIGFEGGDWNGARPVVEKLEYLESARQLGATMANVLFNLKQNESLNEETRKIAESLQERWDSELRKPLGEQEK